MSCRVRIRGCCYITLIKVCGCCITLGNVIKFRGRIDTTMRSLKCYLLPLTEKAFLSGGVIAAAARQIDDVLRFRLAVPQNASPTLRNHLAELYQLYPGLIPESPYFVDFTKLKDIQYACGECDGLIASSSVQNPNFTEESNLFQVAGKQDHFHVLKVSCSDGLLHARQRVAIGAAHWRLEEQLRSSQLSHTILRMNTSMQSFCRGKMRDMVQSRTLSIPIRRGKVAFVDESDVADVIVTLCQQHVTAPWETKELSVTGPGTLSLYQK